VLVLSGLLARSGAGAAPPQLTPPLVPDPHLTPGATLDVTTDDICVPGYAKKVRNVPGAIKQQPDTAYGITRHAPGEYEIDHLISLEGVLKITLCSSPGAAP